MHWRDDYLGASARLLAVSPSSSPEDKTVYQQIVVAAQRDRSATLADACRAWNCCQVGGVVLLHGGNDIGIRSSAKQFAKLIGVQPEVLSSRAHARVLAFAKPADAVSAPEPEAEWITTPSDISLRTPPGVFAAGRVDRGSVVLLKALAAKPLQGIAPASVADIGCGCGILGIEALSRWPEAQAYFADADARSCAATRDNLAACGQGQNTSVHWWDSAEDIAWPQVDLVLSNPPWHHRNQVDRGPGLRMCEAVGKSLKPKAKALVVATITQPFESALQRHGRIDNILEEDGFKVLLLEKS